MRKNFKTLIGLLVIVLLASFCSSKKGGSNAGLALLALGGSSSSDSKKTVVVPDNKKIDLATSFSGDIRDVIYVKSTDAVPSVNISGAIAASTYVKVTAAGKIENKTGLSLDFYIGTKSINPSANTDAEYKKIGSYTGNTKTGVTIGLESITKESTFTNAGIFALATVAKKVATADGFKNLIADTTGKLTAILGANSASAAISAVNAATSITSVTVSNADITDEKVTAAGGSSGNDNNNSCTGACTKAQLVGVTGNAITTNGTNGNEGTVTITVKGAKFNSIIAANFSVTHDRKLATLFGNDATDASTASVFIRKVNDYQIELGVVAKAAATSFIDDNGTFTLEIKSGAFNNDSATALPKLEVKIETGTSGDASAATTGYVAGAKKIGELKRHYTAAELKTLIGTTNAAVEYLIPNASVDSDGKVDTYTKVSAIVRAALVAHYGLTTAEAAFIIDSSVATNNDASNGHDGLNTAAEWATTAKDFEIQINTGGVDPADNVKVKVRKTS